MNDKIRVIGTTGGALGLGAFAAAIAACCGVPWAVALLGVSGAVLHNSQVTHYWNPSGAFGRLLSQAVALKNGERQVYAWDVWLICGPDAKWEGVVPPRPRLLMHQLGALRGSTTFPHLDSHIFAQEVQSLLAQLPPPNATPTLAHSPQ